MRNRSRIKDTAKMEISGCAFIEPLCGCAASGGARRCAPRFGALRAPLRCAARSATNTEKLPIFLKRPRMAATADSMGMAVLAYDS